MASILYLFKRDLIAAASILGDINDFSVWPKDETKLANGYIEAEKAGNEILMNAYAAALILRHWKDINRLYQRCKTCDSRNTLADFATIVYERIMYAIKYKRWVDNPKLTAQQCINMAISTEVKNQMYFSNLQKNIANSPANKTSLDKSINNSGDDRETTLGDTLADSTYHQFSSVDGVIQEYINNTKIIEAIVIDTIANNPTVKITSENTTRMVEVKDKDGNPSEESVKYKKQYVEFWRFKAAEYLMNLPENYIDEFKERFDISAEMLAQAYEAITKAKNQKIYKYLDGTLADLRNNPDIIKQLLA